MTTALALLILIAPFACAAALSRATHRRGSPRMRVLDGDRDALRISHDIDAIRTRFEDGPSWPSSGPQGERR